MSTSGDGFITTDDIVGYLEDRDPANMGDELEEIYDRIGDHYADHLQSPQEYDEWDLVMAKYWLSQAWLVEGEVEKEGY